jgi:hypothetical protein
MQIARVDSNNKVVNTFSISDSKVIALYGSVTFENAQNYCNEIYKDTNLYTYIPEIKGITINEPNIGFNYNPSTKVFCDNQPFNSWTLDNTTGIWNAPYNFDSQNDTYGKIFWEESTQRWKGKKTANFGKPDNENPTYVCDPITKSWTLV